MSVCLLICVQLFRQSAPMYSTCKLYLASIQLSYFTGYLCILLGYKEYPTGLARFAELDEAVANPLFEDYMAKPQTMTDEMGMESQEMRLHISETDMQKEFVQWSTTLVPTHTCIGTYVHTSGKHPCTYIAYSIIICYIHTV